MNKSTIFLLLIAALGLGSLIGVSFVESDKPLANDQEKNPNILSTGGAPTFRFVAPGDLEIEMDEFGRAKPSAIGENFIGQDKVWRTETLVIELPIDGKIEYKAIMDQGDSIVFDWKSDRHPLYTDFHGHDTAFGDDFFLRYEEIESDKQSGMIVAAFSGEHGWYWMNLGDSTTTITLRVAGFFDEIIRVEIESY